MNDDNKSNSTYLAARTVSVLVPALNEENNLAGTVDRLVSALDITIDEYEIIIINDGSTDDTANVAAKLAAGKNNIKVVNNEKCMGLGYVYMQGAKLATKEYFVYIPGDNTWQYRSFIELFGNIGKADIITSFSSNAYVRPFGRRIVSMMFTKVMNALFSFNMRYFNGLTIYPVEFLRLNPISTYGFGFQSEALIKAVRLGYSIIEVGLPIDERTAGGSKAVNIKNILSVIKTIFKLFWDLRICGQWKGKNAGNNSRINIGSNTNLTMEELGFRESQVDAKLNNNEKNVSYNILITGASSGIGEALMKQLADSGHKIFACARNLDNLNKGASNSSFITTFACDVSNEKQVLELAKQVEKQVENIDVVINCAGKFGAIGSIEKVSSSEWLDTLQVNLYGPFLITKHFLKLLKKSTRPQVINFSGGGAFSPFPNYSAYSCSKSALVRLTETLAAELAVYGITVNAIAPGIIATPAHTATLNAGADLAGKLQYNRTKRLVKDGGASLSRVVECVKMLISDKFIGLTGKTISSNFDPWDTASFQNNIRNITRSDLYTLRRINIVNLPDGDLHEQMSEAWARHKIQ